MCSCSLKQGIRDGFLAPCKVVKVHIDRDVGGYRPEVGQLDREGEEVECRIYNVNELEIGFNPNPVRTWTGESAPAGTSSLVRQAKRALYRPPTRHS